MGQGDPFSFPNHGGLGFLLGWLGFCRLDTSWSPLGEKEPQLRNGSFRLPAVESLGGIFLTNKQAIGNKPVCGAPPRTLLQSLAPGSCLDFSPGWKCKSDKSFSP